MFKYGTNYMGSQQSNMKGQNQSISYQGTEQECMFNLTRKLDGIKEKCKESQTAKEFLSNEIWSQHYLNQNLGNFFPKNITEWEAKIFSQEEVLSARVLFVWEKLSESHKNQVQQNQLFKKVCQEENPVYKGYKILKKIKTSSYSWRSESDYHKRYLSDISLIENGKHSLLQNYKFYMNEKTINSLHSKKQNYQWLEDRHDYIQFMFPNHFKSFFNDQASPMSYLEVKLFRNDRKLGSLMLKSLKIYLDFIGVNLQKTGEMDIISQERLDAALLRNTHNHLRIRRVMACLSICGFRNLCLKLIQFLKGLIQSSKKYYRLEGTFKHEWKIYGDKEMEEEALKMCFHPDDKFPDDHVVLFQQHQQQINKDEEEEIEIEKAIDLHKTQNHFNGHKNKFLYTSLQQPNLIKLENIEKASLKVSNKEIDGKIQNMIEEEKLSNNGNQNAEMEDEEKIKEQNANEKKKQILQDTIEAEKQKKNHNEESQKKGNEEEEKILEQAQKKNQEQQMKADQQEEIIKQIKEEETHQKLQQHISAKSENQQEKRIKEKQQKLVEDAFASEQKNE